MTCFNTQTELNFAKFLDLNHNKYPSI